MNDYICEDLVVIVYCRYLPVYGAVALTFLIGNGIWSSSI
jgi:hypothetical protein